MTQFCPWETAKYFIYSSNIPTLFFYSHIPAILVALLVGLLVFYKSGKSRVGATLLWVSLLFSAWCIFDLIIWATNRPDIVLFFWSLQILFEPLVYLICFYLVYIFITGQDLAFKWKLLGMLLYSPIILFLSTQYNLAGVTQADCNAIEGFIAQYFTYIVELISIILIVFLVVWKNRKIPDPARQKEIITFAFGVVLFLFAFSWGNIIGSFSDNWDLAQIGLIGMPIFVGFLAYLIVKFHTFNVKLFATQALVWGLIILIGSQFFFIQVPTNMVLNGVTFIAAIIFGYLLIRSVKKEIQQKEELQKLDIELENLLKQRESLTHLITHKVKGSFTHSKYIFASMLDGTFGEITPELKKWAEKGIESDNVGIDTVDLILNAANMQKGLIKYEMKKIDFKDVVLKTFSEKKVPAETKGLRIEKEIKEDDYSVLGDAFWLKEAVSNLMENSIRYTREGKITVGLEKKPASTQGGKGKILFSVRDTGVGIDEDDKKNLFTEGGRGKDSVKMNVDSTGYGLFTVKLIVEAHQGRVWAESAGANKGSAFFIELPIA